MKLAGGMNFPPKESYPQRSASGLELEEDATLEKPAKCGRRRCKAVFYAAKSLRQKEKALLCVGILRPPRLEVFAFAERWPCAASFFMVSPRDT